MASLLVVSLGKALNGIASTFFFWGGIASTFEWLNW